VDARAAERSGGQQPRPPSAGADVILDVVFDDGLLYLVLANIGDAPAHRVRVRFGERFSGLGGERRIDRLPLFSRLQFLAPRRSIETLLDRASAYFARAEPTVLTARITWLDDEGRRAERTVVHDLEIYRSLPYHSREVSPHAGPS
jgi:hypothetical protein